MPEIKNKYDFVISGAGLVGCLSAILLSRMGYSCCLIEKNIIATEKGTNTYSPLSLNYRSILILKKFKIWGDLQKRQVDTYRTVTLEGNVPYQFDFVASGDSPKEIGITVKLLNYYNPGDKTVFSEYFYKEGTLVDTGISEYYTWDYVGNKNFEISDEQCSSTCNHKIIVWRDVFPIKHDSGGAGRTVTISLLQ